MQPERAAGASAAASRCEGRMPRACHGGAARARTLHSGRAPCSPPGMVRPAAIAAAALLLACGPRRLTPGEYQRQVAHVLSPAPVRAPPAAVRPAEVKTLRLLAYADAEHRASAPDWEARILDLVRRANALLEVQFGVRFDVAVRPWERNPDDETLLEALGQLERL